MSLVLEIDPRFAEIEGESGLRIEKFFAREFQIA